MTRVDNKYGNINNTRPLILSLFLRPPNPRQSISLTFVFFHVLLSAESYCGISSHSMGGLTNIRHRVHVGCVGAGRGIVLLINGVIKVLSLTSHWLTGMDGLLARAPGIRTFHNEWQLLPARLGGD